MTTTTPKPREPDLPMGAGPDGKIVIGTEDEMRARAQAQAEADADALAAIYQDELDLDEPDEE